jgi:hypothetical protein
MIEMMIIMMMEMMMNMMKIRWIWFRRFDDDRDEVVYTACKILLVLLLIATVCL